MSYTIEDNGELAAICENETERVVCWREDTLTLAGWRTGHARTMAEQADIDLRLACRLLELGCDEDTAWRILR